MSFEFTITASDDFAKVLARAIVEEQARVTIPRTPLTPRQFAKEIGVSERSVYRMIEAGTIQTVPGSKRIPERELQRFL